MRCDQLPFVAGSGPRRAAGRSLPGADRPRVAETHASRLTAQLNCAATQGRWDRVQELAHQVLALAPEHRLAHSLLKVARRESAAGTAADRNTHPDQGSTVWVSNSGAACVNEGNVKHDRWTEQSAARFLLWVDGVGGYLVCLAPKVTLGQAVPGGDVDVPILADVSRRHAVIAREGDRYVLEPLQPVCVHNLPCVRKTVLRDGDEIDLGSGVRVKFRQPHALSASARLDFLSRNRLQSAADGVVLMAESCVLGPSWQNHVVCREWERDVVLYRRDGMLYCRSGSPLEVDGQTCTGQAQVRCGSRIDGEDFSISLEQA